MKKTFTDQIFDKIEKENISYSNKSDDEKKQYWVWNITQTFHNLDEWKKINIIEYRNTEPNIDLFLPAIIDNIESYHWEDRNSIIQNYFILDEQAKKALEVVNQKSNTSNVVKSTINTENTNKLENISFEVLAEKIWDLYYDALSFFLEELSENINNTEIKKLVKEASINIDEAWTLCKLKVEEFIKNWWKVWKHTQEVKWLNIEKKELAKLIWNLENSQLSDFLEKLSAKMYKDWIADEWRKRIKLSNELYACADKLKQASEII